MAEDESGAIPEANSPAETFLRRIPPYQYNHNTGSIHAIAFRNDRIDSETMSDRLSVNWERYSSLEETLKGHAGFGVVSITGEVLQKENQYVKHSPEPENYSHCDVIGDKPNGVQNRIRKSCKILRIPEQIP